MNSFGVIDRPLQRTLRCRYTWRMITLKEALTMKVIFISVANKICFTFAISTQFLPSKSPQYSRYCVGLLDVKPEFEPQARHQNEVQKIFLQRFPLSRYVAKTLRVNKISMKSFSKILSFGVDFKLQVPPLIYKIRTHNISGVGKKVNNPD